MGKFQQTHEVITYLQKYISGKTLDLGAGSGKYRNIIKEKAENYLAFDVKPGPAIDIVGDALDLPFGVGIFDTIVCTQVLEHVDKPWIAVKEMSRVLKKGGICILTAPFMEPYHQNPGDYFRYTIEGIKSLFKNEGFEVLECSSYGQVFSVISEFVRFSLFHPYKKRKKGSSKIIYLMNKIAAFLNKFSKNEIIYSDVYIAAQKM